jgi:hypothetical protein
MASGPTQSSDAGVIRGESCVTGCVCRGHCADQARPRHVDRPEINDLSGERGGNRTNDPLTKSLIYFDILHYPLMSFYILM